MKCRFCGGDGVHECDLCHQEVCSSHFDVRSSLCIECAGVPRTGACEICSRVDVLRRCADCDLRVCNLCYDVQRQVCRRCKEKYFKD